MSRGAIQQARDQERSGCPEYTSQLHTENPSKVNGYSVLPHSDC